MQSGEHVLTKSIFDSTTVEVQGFPWCRDKMVTVGRDRLTINVLCDTHNNSLTEVDTAGKLAFDALKQHHDDLVARLSQPGIRHRVNTYSIDGLGLERWMVKTTINLCYAGGLFSLRPFRLPETGLVELAFGMRQFAPGSGLHAFSFTRGATVQLTPTWRFLPLYTPPHDLVGAIFEVWGWRLLLAVRETATDPKLHATLATVYPAGPFHLTRRPTRFVERGKKSIASLVRFDWKHP